MKMHEKAKVCEICGHETSVLDFGTGEYAEKLVCKLCESRNFTEQLLRARVYTLKYILAEMVEWYYKQDPPSELLEKAERELKL